MKRDFIGSVLFCMLCLLKYYYYYWNWNDYESGRYKINVNINSYISGAVF